MGALSHRELIEKLIDVDRISDRLNGATAVICMSNVLKEACEAAGVLGEKILVLGNRVSTQRFRPVPQANYDPGTIRALFVGRLVEQKNVHGTASALALLRERGWRVHLDVCGRDRGTPYLREAMSPLRPDEWTHWGAVSNSRLPSLLAAVDMYVGPSFFEGFQIPLIESLAAGRPCVASSQPPADEILDRGCGALVDPGDPAAIAAGILDVKERLNDPTTAAALRQTCRRAALERWDYSVVSRREVDCYARALNQHSERRG